MYRVSKWVAASFLHCFGRIWWDPKDRQHWASRFCHILSFLSNELWCFQQMSSSLRQYTGTSHGLALCCTSVWIKCPKTRRIELEEFKGLASQMGRWVDGRLMGQCRGTCAVGNRPIRNIQQASFSILKHKHWIGREMQCKEIIAKRIHWVAKHPMYIPPCFACSFSGTLCTSGHQARRFFGICDLPYTNKHPEERARAWWLL